MREVRHSPLLVAAGLVAVVSAVALGASAPSIAASPVHGPEAAAGTASLAALDLILAGIMGWAAFRADRGRVIGVSVLAVIAAAYVGLIVLEGAVDINNRAAEQATAVLFLISVASNALIVSFAGLELFIRRQGQETSTSESGVT
jgi:hypothetical protein